MKHLILILLSLSFLASPARADDTITSWSWSSVTGALQAKLASLGWENVPTCTPWQSWTPTVTQGSGSPSGVSCTAQYQQCWKTVAIGFNCSLTTGTSISYVGVSLPLPMSSAFTNSMVAYGRSGGTGRAVEVDMGTSIVQFFSDVNGTGWPASTATTVRLDLVYQTN